MFTADLLFFLCQSTALGNEVRASIEELMNHFASSTSIYFRATQDAQSNSATIRDISDTFKSPSFN